MAYISYCESPYSHWMLYSNFDTINGSWSHISPLYKPLLGVTSYYWQDSNKVFLCGGADSLSVLQTSCFFFDPVNNTYSQKAPLPVGRTLGKLVKVRDSLYLVGSVGPSWNSPDGLLYKYDPYLNLWTLKDTMPQPFLHEMAVCVWRDSLIITVGGSANGFIAPTNTVRVYNPRNDRWKTVQGTFPAVVTTSHAECLGDSILVLGGFGSDYLNTVYKGNITPLLGDTINISWTLFDVTPFGAGVYRVGGGMWGNTMLFGPAMRYQYALNQVWGFRWSDSSWIRFIPGTLDSAGDRPTIAVKPPAISPFEGGQGGDSVHFYLFGGFIYPAAVANSEQYSFYPVPIGIISNNNQAPEDYFLGQNYPNPFNPVTRIKFGIPALIPPLKGERGTGVKLTIYDILGREIVVLVDKKSNPGTYEIEWNAGNFSSGVYFYRLEVSNSEPLNSYDYLQTKKLILIK